ncbi:MAG: SufD family Fe-S cluster assembly protein [Erysipelotrichaceae bacterium]
MRLLESGFYQIDEPTINLSEDMIYNLLVENDIDINIKCDHMMNVNIVNGANKAITIRVKGDVYDSLNITFCMFSLKETNIEMDIKLLKEEAKFLGCSSSITKDRQTYKFNIDHLAPYTTSNMESYGVVLEDGEYYCDTIGKISKGNYQSSAYQTTRVLTYKDVKEVKALPVLYIDENDVQAKHACTIGKLDEDQLYYLQSRGINEITAVKLLSHGYLNSVLELILDDDVKKLISDDIEKRVEEICLM